MSYYHPLILYDPSNNYHVISTMPHSRSYLPNPLELEIEGKLLPLLFYHLLVSTISSVIPLDYGGLKTTQKYRVGTIR